MERQGDLMSRSLAQQSGLLNDYQNEKAALMGQLNAMKGVCTLTLLKLDLDVYPSSFIPYYALERALNQLFMFLPLSVNT